jgi:hypothetical protein
LLRCVVVSTIAVMIGAAGTSEKFYQTAQRNNQEDSHFQ